MRSRKQRAFFRLHECTQHNTKPHHPYLSPPAEQLRFLGDEVRPTCREFSFGARQVRTGSPRNVHGLGIGLVGHRHLREGRCMPRGERGGVAESAHRRPTSPPRLPWRVL